MKLLYDGKFGIGLFSGIVLVLFLGLVTDAFELGRSLLSGAIGVLLGGALGALPSMYSQWLSYSQVVVERQRQDAERKSALASNLQAKLMRAASHVSHITDEFEKGKARAESALDKRPTLHCYGIPLRAPTLLISDDELYLSLTAIKSESKLRFLTIQDEFNQLCEMSHHYCRRRQEIFQDKLSLSERLETQISFDGAQRAHIDAVIYELDMIFNSVLERSHEVMAALSNAVIDFTEGISKIKEIDSRLLKLEIRQEISELKGKP